MTRPRIAILNETCLDLVEALSAWLAAQPVEILADASYRKIGPDRLNEVLAGMSGVILPASAPILPVHMEANPSLQVVSIAASGYESVDIETATRYGIVVTYAPVREGAEVVADLTWGLMLAVARQIPYHNRLLQAGRYERGMGVAVWGKTLGIVGLGNIGRAVARRAHAFDMRILATEISPDLTFVRKYDVELVPLEELLRRADFVSLHLRINDKTHGIIGRRAHAMLKATAFLINTARTGLVDEAALQEAIMSGQIAGAAVEDPPTAKDSPLLGLPNFVCTPHLGNRAIEGADAVFRCAIENAVAVIEGRRPEHVLNPQVYDGALRAFRPAQ